jgi:hypothetical protein
MNLSRALTEPFVQFIAFHNAFNKNIKLTYGALAAQNVPPDPNNMPVPLRITNGQEPWGANMRWEDTNTAIREAVSFISSVGISRASSAFEDYLIRINGELDRSQARGIQGVSMVPPSADSTGAPSGADEDPVIKSLTSIVGRLDGMSQALQNDFILVHFFQKSRNCVVHRSNRASKHLAELASSQELADALKTWPKRQGKWALGVPTITANEPVEWLPRHAIMASAVYYRFAQHLDAIVLRKIGAKGLTCMAAHWCLLADTPIDCNAKLDAQTMVRTVVVQRYRAKATTIPEIVEHMRSGGIWPRVQQSFAARGLMPARHLKRRGVL